MRKSSTGLLDTLRAIPRCPRDVLKAYTLWVSDSYTLITYTHPRHPSSTCSHDTHPAMLPTTYLHDMLPTTSSHDMLPTTCSPRHAPHDMLPTTCFPRQHPTTHSHDDVPRHHFTTHFHNDIPRRVPTPHMFSHDIRTWVPVT